MSKYNKRKSDVLGRSFCSAQHELRKRLLFSMAQELNRANCFRCGKSILSHAELSVEHKEPWTCIDTFFDLDNIAFSHLGCNSAQGRAKLTHDQVREIRQSEASTKEIAETYNLSAYHVRTIRARRSWAHID